MWDYIAIGVIGILIGSYLGFWFQGLILKPMIGDDFEINKPKIKGQNNELKIDQQNIVKRIFNRKNKENESEKNK